MQFCYIQRVIVNFLLATGVRLSTLINLKIKHLDFDNMLITLSHTKNRRVQLIPMSRTLSKVLQEYLMYRKGEPEDYLFCNQWGNKFSRPGVQRAIQSYHLKRGINKTSIHMYRHTFARIAVLNGIDPLRLQKILGHRTLEMTRHYINLWGNDLKEGFDRYNPLEVLSNKGDKIKL